MALNTLVRVSGDYPCPVCGKPDWCLRDLSGHKAFCMRIEQGAVKIKRIPQRMVLKEKVYPINWIATQRLYQSNAVKPSLGEFVFGKGWDGEAITYPMYDANQEIIGIQRRFPDGKKMIVRGSRTGLFLPISGAFDRVSYRSVIYLSQSPYLLICEGVSDAIAAYEHLGFASIGRYNCSGGINELASMDVIRAVYPVIIADNDNPGILGAERLQKKLLELGRSSLLVIPPDGINDLAEWVKAGLSRAALLGVLDKAKVWTNTGKSENVKLQVF